MRSFNSAHSALGSSVQWQELSVYELNSETVGEFDFVFMGSVLCHLHDPVAALSAIRRVVRGELLSVDAVSLHLTVLHPRQAVAALETPGWPLWWVPNLRSYHQLFGAAQLELLASGRPFFVKRGSAYRAGCGTPLTGRGGSLQERFKRAISSRLGNLHAWVQACAA